MSIKTALYVSFAFLTGSTAVFAHSDEPFPVQFHQKLLAVNSPSAAQMTVPRAPKPAFAQDDPGTGTAIAQGVGKDVGSAAKNAAENALTQVVGTFIQSDKFLNKRSEINNGIKEQSRPIETKTREYATQPSFDPSAIPGYQMVQVEKAPQYPPEPASGIRQAFSSEQDQKRWEEYQELRDYGVLKKDLAKREEQYRLQKEQRWQQMRDSFTELSEVDQVFVQAEVLLRPGISDLPDVSVYDFVERILHNPMDQVNNQLPQLIQIVKRDNEYTIDIQMKNRLSLLFRHEANGKAAMLQSAIFRGTLHKASSLDFFEMTPLEFVTFLAATRGGTQHSIGNSSSNHNNGRNLPIHSSSSRFNSHSK